MCTDENADGVTDCFVAAAVRTVFDAEALCDCCATAEPSAGANGAARWLDCGACKKRLWLSTRKPGEGSGASRWILFMLALILRRAGRLLMTTAVKARAHLLAGDYLKSRAYLAASAQRQVTGASSSGAAASDESLPRGPRHGVSTWRSMTAISCRDLLLSMPEMGRASDEEIAYLPETELINAAKQFRWIVETAISSARVQTLASQPMPTRAPPPAQGPMPARTPFAWEQPAGPSPVEEPDQELDIDWQAYMMDESVGADPDVSSREPRCGGSRHVPGAGRWGKPWGLAPPGWSRDLHRRHGHGWREVGAEDLVGATTPGAEGA